MTTNNKHEALQALLVDFSAGKLSRSELMNATGLSFEDILTELDNAGLPLPKVRTVERATPEQKKRYEELLKTLLSTKSGN